MSRYRFSAVLTGHTTDVRCLAPMKSANLSNGGLLGLVSGSRDNTAKLWVTTPESKDREWKEERTFTGHQKFVTSVAVSNPSEDFPEGLVYTGCNGGMIRAFSPATSNPLFELEAHSSCVSSLFVSSAGTLLSGSWDGSAKVWVKKLKHVMSLHGHENAVWSVAILPESGIMVTGSADKSIRLWIAGTCKEILADAHSQAIRKIAVIDRNSFLSTGNDGEIKQWKVDTESAKASMVNKFIAHGHFIYSMTILDPIKETFAIGGENSGVKLFQRENETQVLQVPAISVWDVTAFSNGDIAAACSDGKVWLFSADPKRQAEDELNKLYELELSKFQRPAKTELEGINTEDLPGPSALLAPGRRDGQTKMIKDGDTISVHSWSEADQKWTKIGDVVGQPGQDSGGAAPDGGKVVYEGKEYDFVFDIELDSGVKLKLPFNRSDDVWQTAQSFIHKHELPQGHLDTIANFLIKNGGGKAQSKPVSGGVYDPFTGSNAYSSNGDNIGTPMDVDNTHYPLKSPLAFTVAPKFEALTKKLLQFNQEVDEGERLAEDKLERMHKLCIPGEGNLDDLIALVSVFRWPMEKIFPALDILRLAVINSSMKSLLTRDEFMIKVFDILAANLSSRVPDNCQMLALRGISNLFQTQEGRDILLKRREAVIRAVAELLPKENKNVQVAMATVILNYSVELINANDEEGQTQCLTAICMLFLEAITDPEAKYRVLVALGTLISSSESNATMAKNLQIKTMLETWKATSGDVKKVEECVSFLMRTV